MIYDSFMFFKDFDLLEIRLEEHWDIVDKFIITEATFTQSCQRKPLYYEENKDRFKKYHEKIIHMNMGDRGFRDTYPYRNERTQRNYFRNQLDYKDDDIFILSDADEIMNSKVVKELNLIEETAKHKVIQTNLSLHHFFVNYTVKGFNWTGALITTGEMVRFKPPSSLRRRCNDYGWKNVRVVNNVGWHFSWMGGMDAINEKLEAVCNREYVTDHYLSKMDFETRIREGVTFDFLTDGYRLVVDNEMELPKHLLENKERFAHLFL